MGKNRKAKQAMNQAHVDSDDGGCGYAEVPAEFLTSDDFQVVHKKRHHSSKKSLDEHPSEGFLSLPRSRSNSERFTTDVDETHGCHSGFWTTRSHQNRSSEDIDGMISAVGSLNCNENRAFMARHSDDCLSVSKKNSSDFERGECVSSCKLEQLKCSKIMGIEDNNFSHVEKQNGTSVSRSSDSYSDGQQVEASLKESVFSDNEKFSAAKCNENGGKLSSNEDTYLDDYAIDKKATLVEINGRETIECVVENVKPIEDIQTGVAYEGHTVKSTAQKKKEKKVRDKQKKVDTCSSRNRTSSRNSETHLLVSSSSSDFSEMTSSNTGEKVEQGSKKDEITNKGDRKRPSKKQLAAIHEALRRAKEDEERQKMEEETKKRLAEEAERQEQERLRLEQEKKENKKLKEKQKREKMKAEGRLLSKSQKQSRARMQATLEAFRQQGVDIPHIGEKRPRGPRLGNYKTSSRKRLDSSQSDSGLVKSERHKSESLSSQESSGKESLSDLPSSFESKDSWDMNIIGASGVTNESEGQFSCSEESDALCEDHSSSSTKENVAVKLKDSLEKTNLAKLKSGDTKTSSLEEKKDSVRLRSPVICVLGHVDTGKTKLLDYIRKTHIQDSEAGGITQQIGATMIPQDALKEKCKMVKDFSSFEIKVPGLLVIDTPGHESFRNLRFRGTSICDIAIVVVDIMHGLEPQTLESINLLKTGKIPFVVALNKIDRLYGWKSVKDEDIESVISQQNSATLMEFKTRCQEIVLQFANECLNAVLYYENKDPRSYVSMVPTSAITGDGMGNLLSLITQLTQSLMHKKLVFSQELQATVLEVKVIAGLGTTIDVILVNGRLLEGDSIVLAGHEGPIVTQIRSLLMPQPLKELRVKNPYIEYKAVEGAQGVKITGKDLDKTVAGLPLFVANNQTKMDQLKADVTELLDQTVNYIKISERGVYVQASTLGSLEALLEYLTSSGIPYFGVKIGPVVKKDVMKASIMLEHDVQYAAILAFDVKIERDAQELADSLGVKVFHANIIYHLFDQFLKHREEATKKREEARHLAVFPCILKIHPQGGGGDSNLKVFVEAGTLREGTPLCVPTKGNLDVGVVASMKVNHRVAQCAKEGEDALIVLEVLQGGLPKVFGEDFDQEDYLVSRISKQSIDVCKEYYRDELESTDWHLMNELKKMLHLHA